MRNFAYMCREKKCIHYVSKYGIATQRIAPVETRYVCMRRVLPLDSSFVLPWERLVPSWNLCVTSKMHGVWETRHAVTRLLCSTSFLSPLNKSNGSGIPPCPASPSPGLLTAHAFPRCSPSLFTPGRVAPPIVTWGETLKIVVGYLYMDFYRILDLFIVCCSRSDDGTLWNWPKQAIFVLFRQSNCALLLPLCIGCLQLEAFWG